jgi:hypothetical protein
MAMNYVKACLENSTLKMMFYFYVFKSLAPSKTKGSNFVCIEQTWLRFVRLQGYFLINFMLHIY